MAKQPRRHHKQQHRPTSESKTPKALEVRELRSLNRKLKVENARLRRRINKRLEAFDTLVEEVVPLATESLPVEEVIETPVDIDQKCPECGSSDVMVLSLPSDYLVCKACKWRKKL